MTLRRYSRSPILLFGKKYGTSFAIPAIRDNINNGNIKFDEYIVDASERLDIIAGKVYNDGRLWWIIGAASGIGWGLQVPPGTVLKIPNLEDINKFVG